jgi:hypothetical protein
MPPNANSIPSPSALLAHRLWIVQDMAGHLQVHGRTFSITLNDFLVLQSWVLLTRSKRMAVIKPQACFRSRDALSAEDV